MIRGDHLSKVLAGALLLGVQLVVQVLLLACQHPDLLLHAVHLTPDLLCIALKPAQHSSL